MLHDRGPIASRQRCHSITRTGNPSRLMRPLPLALCTPALQLHAITLLSFSRLVVYGGPPEAAHANSHGRTATRPPTSSQIRALARYLARRRLDQRSHKAHTTRVTRQPPVTQLTQVCPGHYRWHIPRRSLRTPTLVRGIQRCTTTLHPPCHPSKTSPSLTSMLTCAAQI